jgi:hypothetical protein
MITSGFAEMGEAGMAAQARLLEPPTVTASR